MNKSNNSTGLSFTTILTIIFVVLKLTENINWSWWLVLSPMIISVLLILVLILVLYILRKIENRYEKFSKSTTNTFKVW